MNENCIVVVPVATMKKMIYDTERNTMKSEVPHTKDYEQGIKDYITKLIALLELEIK